MAMHKQMRRQPDAENLAFDASTGDLLVMEYYRVYPLGVVVNLGTGNFANYPIFQYYLVLFLAALSFCLWHSFSVWQKEAGYSYHAIFSSGFGIWTGCMAIYLLIAACHHPDMAVFFSVLQKSGILFMQITCPLILVFAIALSISNISLIRHEGFRKVNLLGIGISCVMLLGAGFVLWINSWDYMGSHTGLQIRNILISTYTSVYVLLECFLIGAVICGVQAAVSEPALDRDYIIILGCTIKPDGTLYPLIQGREAKQNGISGQMLLPGNSSVW